MASRDRVAQAKSRAERSRPPTVPVPQIEIIPGRLTEGDWLSMLNFEEAEDSVGDILAGMLDQVMDECYKLYLSRQCIPYVINQAREAMLQIIEWRFLVRDEGEMEVPTDPAWQEDEEPMPCITDAWAEGSVPVVQPAPESEVLLARLLDEALAMGEEVEPAGDLAVGVAPAPGVALASLHALQQETEAEEQPVPASLPDIQAPKTHSSSSSSRVRVRVPEDLPPVKEAATLPAPPCSSTKLWVPPQGHEGSPRAARFSCPLVGLKSSEKDLLLLRKFSQFPVVEDEDEDVGHPHLLPPSCSNLLRIQVGRPPITKDVFYDEHGRVTMVPRLDPARLPKHWIRPTVEVVDPDVESRRQEALKTVSGRCTRRWRSRRHPAKHPGSAKTGTEVGPGAILPPGVPTVLLWEGPARAMRQRLSEQVVHRPPPPGKVLEPTALYFVKPTLLMETMELAPGVTLRCSGSTTQRSQPVAPWEEEVAGEAHRELRPLCPHVPFPMAAPEQMAGPPRPLPRLHPGATARPGCPC